MKQPNYTRLTAPTGHEITLGIKSRFFLVLNTNFNPINFLDFGEINISSIPDVAQMDAVHTYDDGTGFFIFRLKKDFIQDNLIESIMKEFQEYFIN